ncbi:IgGFc-binding protein [Paraliomyxa miuraensis]|uniref:IgGFc-binding protein n=1 Tax=Paraliomyxa miuraensis TaxID=376150 RepID=UPI00224D98A1|nr:IgGFc-binding protein [Paraliomyxa miuraensis]MCX4241071.1 IgGFc-binding protein [Paraliomyxa miuraensis]
MVAPRRPGWIAGVGLMLACGDTGEDPSVLDETRGTGSTTLTPTSGSTSPSATTTGLDSTTSSHDAADIGPEPDVPIPLFDVGGVTDMGANSVACSSDLKQVVSIGTGAVVETCPPDEGCLQGQCIPACLAAAGSEGSLGCEFLVPSSPFFANGNPAAAQSGPCHALLVSNPWDRPALLDLSRDGMPYDVSLVTRIPNGIGPATTYGPLPPAGIPSGQVAVVFLSHRPGVFNANSLECPIAPAVLADTATHGTAQGVAFSLESDTPVQVYDIIPYGGASTYLPSASLLYPSTAWGDGYVLVSPHPPDGTEWLLAVVRDDATTLSIQPTVAIAAGSIPNPPVAVFTQYVANAGEVLQWHALGDPYGTILSADKPIGVFSGNTYLQVSTTDGPLSGRDSAHQMIPDVNALASEYVGAGLLSRLPGLAPESVRYRLVGVVDGTTLSWDAASPPGAPATLNAGQMAEFESTATFSVASQDEGHPFSLSQYMSGTLGGQPGCTGIPGPCGLGDDDWVVLVPPAQFLRSYAFFVDPTYGTSSLVVVREAGPTGFELVTLDCMGTITGWQPVGTDGRFEYAHVELFRGGVASVPACATSQHLATSDGNFGIVVWGQDAAASYGYPAGGNLRSINAIDVDPAG